MHVKQLTTSQAFQMIPRKAIVYQDVKALQVSLLKERQAAAKMPRPAGIWGHRTVICIFHKSIATRYCLQTVQPASLREELVLAGLTHTPTEQNITTMGDLIIAMCFQMVCYDSEQQEDYNTRYSIV